MKKRIGILLIIFAIVLFPNQVLAKEKYSDILKETVDLTNGVEVGKTAEKCMQSDTSGKYYTAKWNENLSGDGRELIGAVWACRREVTSVDTTAITYSASGTNKSAVEKQVQDKVNDKNKTYTKPACCDWKGDPKKGYSCSGSSACNPNVCSAVNCTSSTSGGGGSGSGSGGSSGGGGGGGGRGIRFVMLKKIVLPIPIREFTTYNSIKERVCIDNPETGEILCEKPPKPDPNPGTGNDSGSPSVTTWTCSAECPNRIITLGDKCIDSESDITVPLYDMDIDGTKYDGDPIYCLQPGANGPTAEGLKYLLDTKLDVGKCQDQYIAKRDLYDKNGNYLETIEENAIQCGLAQILYSAHTHSVDANGNDVWTRKSGMTDGTITLALRLWMAAYAKTPNGTATYPSQITNPTYTYVDSEGIDDPAEYVEYQAFNASSPLAWVPEEDYYDKTAQKIKNGGTYNTKNSAISSKTKNIIHCADDESEDEKNGNCVIDRAIKLFHEAESVSKENYLGGINFDREVPVIQYEYDTGIFEVKFDNRNIVERVKENCEDLNDPECKIQVRIFDTAGNDVTDKLEIEKVSDGGSFFDKNSFIAKIVGIKEYCIGGGYEELKLVIIFKEWTRNYGYVRLYTATGVSNPEKYQKMVSFGLKQEKCESEQSEYRDGRIETPIRIPCDCESSTCTDLSGTETPTGSTTCSTKKTIKDANMNCIVNSCPLDVNSEFNVTARYGLNPRVCTVYERDETELYLPGSAAVYSGMQFSYDLANELKSSVKLDSEHKITGVAMQKRQITSKINYNYWESEYIKKQNLLYYSYLMGYSNEYKNALKNEINAWIQDLNNCNFVSTGSRSDALYKINAEVNNVSSCENDSCVGLNVNYKGTGTLKNESTGLYDGDANYGNIGRLAVHTVFNNIELKDSKGNSYRKYYNLSTRTLDNSPNSSSIPFNLYYCTSSGSTKCYEYVSKNNAVEIMMGSTSTGKIKGGSRFKRYTNLNTEEAKATYAYINDKTLRQYNCSGSSCTFTALDVPQNDYVTVIYNVENDYYNNKTYKVEAYTGKVVEGALTSQEQKELNKGSAKFVPLDRYVYPISVNSKTGTYPITFTFSNIKSKNRKQDDGTPVINSSNYSSSCYYKVYNITTSYDCDVMDKNGNIDLSKCQDTKYEVVSGVPKIAEDKIIWTTTDDGKQYGYLFRTVDLDNLFPNAKVTSAGISTRESGMNWNSESGLKAIDEIEKSAETIFSDDKYLQYSYTITPQGINEIKDYNDFNLDRGGYLNSTLINCKVETDETGLKRFENCKSSFLEEIRGYSGVTVNKEGGSR